MSAAKAAYLGALFAGGYRMASGAEATVPPFTVTCLAALVESAIAAGDARYLEQLTAVRPTCVGAFSYLREIVIWLDFI